MKLKLPSRAFLKRLGTSILFDVVFGPRICEHCVREGDATRPARFGAFSRCARCGAPKGIEDVAILLMHTGSACPICRINHTGACAPWNVEKILAIGRTQG